MKQIQNQPGEVKNVKVSGVIDARFTPEFLKDLRASQNREDARDSRRLRMESATLVIVLAYTTFACWQGWSNQRAAGAAKAAAAAAENANRIANTSLVETNRSWLEIEPDPKWINQSDLAKALSDLKVLAFPLTIKNIGRFPIKNIQMDATAEMPNALDPISLDFRQTHSSIRQNIIYPGVASSIPAMPMTVVPNYRVAGAAIKESDKKALAAGTKYILVYARGTFSDGFGKHWVQFCTPIVFSDEWRGYQYGQCVDYNNTGDGDAPWKQGKP